MNQGSREETIFKAAIKLETPEERAAYLTEACKGDPDLLARLECLLHAHDEVANEDYLEAPLLEPEVTLLNSPFQETPGTVIGRYKLLEKIGEGGMAVVYMAEQKRPVRRKVALKIIKLGMDTKQVIGRFKAERQALALMDHPNIAKVFDGGATDTGRPYFVMELVRGIDITDYCDQHTLTTHQRLELFIEVCQAVQHAHQKGIIHRDIKPSNVLVTMGDGRPVPKVIDFGIAKATNQRLTEKTVFTRFAQMIGTPQYMSPEQAEMSELDIDTRTDVYSLGVLLYELLTGASPFDPNQLRQAGYVGIQRIIRETEPQTPSAKLSTLGLSVKDIAQHRHTTPETLWRFLRGDLDWIVMKTLEKDRAQRYDTAHALAEDIERHLNSEPVLAGAPKIPYIFSKFIRRHRVGVATGLLVAAALVTGFITTSVMYFQAETARKTIQEQKETAEDERKKTAAALRQSQFWLYVSNLKAAQNAVKYPGAASARSYLDRCPKEFHGWEWHRLNSLADRSISTFQGDDWNIRSVAYSPDDSHVFSIGYDNVLFGIVVKLLNVKTEKEIVVLREEGRGAASLSPDGKRIISLSLNHMTVHDAITGAELKKYKLAPVMQHFGPTSLDISPDGSRIVAISHSISSFASANIPRFDPIKVLDISTGKKVLNLSGHKGYATSAVFSPDGNRIASGSTDKTAKVWDSITGTELVTLIGHESEVTTVAYSPDGRQIASGSKDMAIKVWDADTGTELMTLLGHREEISSLAYSPDGGSIVSASSDKTVKLWDTTTGEALATFHGHELFVSSVAFSSDGKRVVSCGKNIKIWDTDIKEDPLILRGHKDPLCSLAFSPDSKRIVSGGYDQTVRIWDTNTGEEIMTLHGHESGVSSVAYSPDGMKIVSSGGKFVKIWDSNTGKEQISFENAKSIMSAVFSLDGKRIISGDDYNTVKVWDVATGTESATILGHGGPMHSGSFSPHSVFFSPDGQRLFACDNENIKVWDIETGKELVTIVREGLENVADSPGLAVSPDGKRIVSGTFYFESAKDQLKIWNSTSGEELCSSSEHAGRLFYSFAFSPEGDRIVSGGSGGTTVWDANLHAELMNFGRHEGLVISVAFSPDGRYIASADESSTIKIWSCAPH